MMKNDRNFSLPFSNTPKPSYLLSGPLIFSLTLSFWLLSMWWEKFSFYMYINYLILACAACIGVVLIGPIGLFKPLYDLIKYAIWWMLSSQCIFSVCWAQLELEPTVTLAVWFCMRRATSRCINTLPSKGPWIEQNWLIKMLTTPPKTSLLFATHLFSTQLWMI